MSDELDSTGYYGHKVLLTPPLNVMLFSIRCVLDMHPEHTGTGVHGMTQGS